MSSRVRVGPGLRLSTLGIALLMALACTPPAATPTSAPAKQPAPAKEAAPAAAPKAAEPAAKAPAKPSVQRVVMGVVPAVVESNDVRHLGQTNTWQIKPMYEYLTGMDAESGKIIAQLATEWRVENEGRDVRFLLRKGVQFHKGYGEFTGRDVLFSWQDVAKEDSQHGESPYWRSIVKGIELVNDHEVVFHLNRVDGNFFRAVGEAESGMEMRSKAQYDAKGEPTMDTEPIVGTAPYQYKERRQGAGVVFERVPYQHWRVTPDFPEFEFRFQREASTRLAALQAGEIHITHLPEDQLVDADRRGFKIISGKDAGLRTFLSSSCCFLNDARDPSQGYKYPDSPLMDVKVRRALNKAVNRDELNKAFFAGKGEPMILNHFHPSRPGWNPEWEKRFAEEYGYDPAKAKALLAEAGKPNLSTNIHVQPIPQYAGAEDVAEAIAGYWEKIGVTVERVQMDGAQRQARTRERGFNNHYTVGGTSSWIFIGMTAYTTSRGPRGNAVEDPVVDNLLDQVRATLDEKEQEQYFRQLGDAMFERHMHVPLFWLPAEAVINTKFVSDWVYPGSITSVWTHLHNVKSAQ